MLRKESPVKTRAMKKKQKYEEHFNTGKSAGGNEYSVEKSSRYVKRRQSRGALTETCIEVDKCHTTLISDKQLSFSKSSFKEELLHNIAIPIAHRTRRSMMNSLKRTNIPSNDRMLGKTYSMDDGILQNEGRGVNWIDDAPGPSKTIQSSSKFGPNQISKIGKDEHQLQDRVIKEGLRDERSQISYQKKDASSHTKKRRTRTVSDIIDNTTNSSVPSDALDGAGKANAQISTREKRLKTNPTSTFLSFNTVKRKTRSATRSNLPSIHLSMAVLPKPDVTSCSPNPATAGDSFASGPCGPSMDRMTTGRREPIVYGIRTRSSGISDPFMPSDKRSTEVLIRDKIRKPGMVDAAVNCLMDAKSNEAPTEHLILPTSGVPTGSGSEGGANPSTSPVQGSPKEKGPCEETTTLSPVCTGNDPEKLPGKGYLPRSSLMRELVRLDAIEAKQTTALKDRRRRDMASICVVFSHHLGEDTIKHQKKILSRLGGSIASSALDATHFIADKFVRTRNMLEALALGKPVVTHFWLESCGQASCFIDEKNYILRDLKKEKEIGFSMPVSLARAYQRPLLQGKRVYITANVKPDRELVASLVKAVHGQAIERIGRFTVKSDRIPDDLLVISCEEDYSLCTPLLEKGAEIYTSELLLNGIVIQKLEYERHHLFQDHVKRTRSTVWLRKEAGTQFIPVTRRR